MSTKDCPVTSTYIHVPSNAPISRTIDSSSYGTSATIRVGEYGANDAALFFRTPEQLERLAEEASRAAKEMRKAIELRNRLQIVDEAG